MPPGNNTATAFRSGVVHIEDIDAQIDDLKEQIKGLKGERKATLQIVQHETGFVPRVTDQIVKERRMDPLVREAFQTQLEIARATMGTLNGTPLGEAARKAYDKKQDPSDTRTEDPDQEALPGVEDLPKSPAAPTPEELDVAWQTGAKAAKNGKRVTENPYPADQSALRAQWDSGWCHENGSDGMDIPDALKPKRKKKDGGAGGEDQKEAA
jgi:hypothetical protein